MHCSWWTSWCNTNHFNDNVIHGLSSLIILLLYVYTCCRTAHNWNSYKKQLDDKNKGSISVVWCGATVMWKKPVWTKNAESMCFYYTYYFCQLSSLTAWTIVCTYTRTYADQINYEIDFVELKAVKYADLLHVRIVVSSSISFLSFINRFVTGNNWQNNLIIYFFILHTHTCFPLVMIWMMIGYSCFGRETKKFVETISGRFWSDYKIIKSELIHYWFGCVVILVLHIHVRRTCDCVYMAAVVNI